MRLQHLRAAWWQLRNERPLLATFWPHDYRRDEAYPIAGHRYRITRYVRSAADPRFFEVWGQAVPAAAVPRAQLRGHRARIYRTVAAT